MLMIESHMFDDRNRTGIIPCLIEGYYMADDTNLRGDGTFHDTPTYTMLP